MKYVVTSDKSIDEVCQAMEEAVPAHKFGIVGIHDLKATMAKKGVEFANEVRVFEICNPMKAKSVLEVDMDLASALPCRISVYQDGGVTKIGMINPTDMLKALSNNPALVAVAEEVEAISIDIINTVK
ncbi:DUF302 domain-containing protein [Hydrogenovibrio sp. JE_KL2]|uniref:DUF302 domain-containing protein n=1 Tax=Hydrogenovibrio sp. JE_KL2 TaxID=2651188 RepID=UPI00128BC85E|nr:DUF302 domain-containing protein [Hydrogenovibrio sp. JE_KL2]MPQ76119.1 DUF302 domain-containing protein [Hydrogenovibrio sp. JE_KL2]